MEIDKSIKQISIFLKSVGIIPLVFFCILFIFLLAISIQRFLIFQIFYYDFGIFAHILWQGSRFQIPYINHFVLGKIMFLGDHFEPSLLIISPIFWLTSNLIILSIQQGLVTFLSSLMMYFIALKKNIHKIASLIIVFLFVVFPGTTNPLLTDWHPESTAGLFLLIFIYLFLFTKKRWLYYLIAFIFLGFKESNSLYLIFTLIWIYILTKKKDALILSAISVCWFFVAINILIPFISQKFYLYTPEISLSPIRIFSNITGNPMKIQYIIRSFTSFGLLPFISGFTLIPVVLDLGLKLIPMKTMFDNFTFGSHYHVYLGIFLTLASITTIAKILVLKNKYLSYSIIVVCLLISAYTARKLTSSPINLLINKTFWIELQNPNKSLFDLIEKVPKKGSVMSQNNLLAYLSNRNENLILLTPKYENFNPDIILFDMSPDQNANNHWESNWDKIEIIKTKLASDNKYSRVKLSNPNYFLFIKRTL
ncbi:hypothetical protein A3C23_02945 [Candidatus Roizmanbacteria bacterium RIFCSPHIGHO2_02_FULL_37_13b]|uniref:Glycosyltransferase RgtA/B/C/D-like domain-containing protein n=1 Tax=Candidatus Roizmanbacteria bacterium RIFCSPLOWO2_02_FULL_36_11 TaxID=1802071 RepID=A0A1F7JI65_9BACT|nr:MAG: hypothetical protein A3C23_02945 [Candidatus Roizmanbacteria bacterium RIFCSPHIGHO2_02_FULL_37_13b]OGK55310.1 MAG: hypothetical protein A3H78_04375 [Candidatus Roizmanbacteria bacterium RIFCSPLOWO2_02_FULL_36_11]